MPSPKPNPPPRNTPSDDRIRDLCAQLMKAQDIAAASAIGDELRQAIHDHMEALRNKLTSSMYIVPPPES